MKKILFAIAALAVAFGFTACSNEDEVLENGKNGKLIVTAFTESGITRTALDGNDEKGYDVVWEKGDKFFIYKVTQQGTDYKTHLPRYMFNRVDGPFNLISEAGTTNGTFEKEGDALPNYEGYVALYPDFPESFEWVMLDDFYPTEQTYSEGNIKGFPMRASFNVENGKIKGSISFQNMNGILRLTVKGTATVKSIKVSAEELSTPITLDCGNGVALTSEGKVFHIAMLDNTYTGVKITLTETDGNTCTKTFKGTDGLKIERSKITTAAFAVSFPPTDALSGKFSVSDTKKVYFAKGNLYYDGSAFKLENNQYSIATSWDSTDPHVSNFYWSATAADAYASDCANEDATYGDVFFTNASETTPNASFTVNGQTGVWRTLSNSEWNYLFSHYTYKYTSVCGKSGIVIAPAGVSVTEIYDSYDKTDWATAEADGFVFLPITGYRYGDYSINENDPNKDNTCLYWSSTLTTTIDSEIKPYRIFFKRVYEQGKWKLDTNFNDANNCNYGIGIRLVQDVK